MFTSVELVEVTTFSTRSSWLLSEVRAFVSLDVEHPASGKSNRQLKNKIIFFMKPPYVFSLCLIKFFILYN